MKLEHKELKDDLEFLQKFANDNITNEYGKVLNRVLIYTKEHLDKEIKNYKPVFSYSADADSK